MEKKGRGRGEAWGWIMLAMLSMMMGNVGKAAEGQAPAAGPAGSPAPPAARTPPAAAANPPASPPPSPPPPSPSPPPPPVAIAPAPAPSPPIIPDNEMAALRGLGLTPPFPNPCSNPDLILCRSGHVSALTLSNCAPDSTLSPDSLGNLTFLSALYFVNCSMKLPNKAGSVPALTAVNLKTLIVSNSLGPFVPASFLAQFGYAGTISVTDVAISGKGLFQVTSGTFAAVNLTISNTNIGFVLPRNTWPTLLAFVDFSHNELSGTIPEQLAGLSKLAHIDFSNNELNGTIPDAIFAKLDAVLEYVNLSSNALTGPIPPSVAALQRITHLDLSRNKLNGSIPANLSSIPTLLYLDLSNNELSGEIPFNDTFLDRLKTIKLGRNSDLCYNHTAVKSKALAGIPSCDGGAVAGGELAPAGAPAAAAASPPAVRKSAKLSKPAAVAIAAAVVVFIVLLLCCMCRQCCCRRSRKFR